MKLEAIGSLKGLPDLVAIPKGDFTLIIEDLLVDEDTDVYIRVISQDGKQLTRSNPLRSKKRTPIKHYWSDLHGQSEESVGTNPCREYFEFGKRVIKARKDVNANCVIF